MSIKGACWSVKDFMAPQGAFLVPQSWNMSCGAAFHTVNQNIFLGLEWGKEGHWDVPTVCHLWQGVMQICCFILSRHMTNKEGTRGWINVFMFFLSNVCLSDLCMCVFLCYCSTSRWSSTCHFISFLQMFGRRSMSTMSTVSKGKCLMKRTSWENSVSRLKR